MGPVTDASISSRSGDIARTVDGGLADLLPEPLRPPGIDTL